MQFALVVLVILVGILGVITWRLSKAILALRADYQQLSRAMAGTSNDLAGLAAAGVNMDRVLVEHNQRLRECLDRLDEVRSEDSAGTAYHGPIERIRKGARAEDLVAEFGLSLSEANLLVRLHATGK